VRVPIAPAALVAPLVVAALVSADNNAQLFTSYDPLALRLEAPFTDLFAHASSPDYSVRGTLSYSDGGRVVSFRDAGITVRGHTSRNEGECSFPKLKVDFDSKADGSTLFGGMKSVKIGTHCGESTDNQLTERFGRLPNQQSPLREAFVYRLLDIFEVPTLRARPARITYVESNAKPPLERNAVIVEGEGDALRRLGGSREIPPEQFTTARAMFSTEDAARLAFAQAMIGNFDWCLKFFDNDTYRCDERRKLWNVMAIAMDGSGRAGARPLIYDFDVAGMVAGKHRWFADVYNTAFSGSRSPAELEVLGQVQRTRSLFSRVVLDAARAHFAGRKSAAYGALQATQIDASGRQSIREYLDSFFSAIASDDAFYRPVVTATGVNPFADAGRAQAVCPALGAIPVGTPISDPLDRRGDMIQVVLLDALWKWATPAKCADIHTSPVWIPANSVSRDYPAR
jgi:hypothetical protein